MEVGRIIGWTGWTGEEAVDRTIEVCEMILMAIMRCCALSCTENVARKTRF